ncbi:MAG TPA: antibiotic biosynthesis monooxygenase [Candidatus Kapabacteria bacterium]|nr:antibiotic biosynthesis monooxygenase [Candidatus Kapabacteria bacterium]
MFVSPGLAVPYYAVIFSSVRRMDDASYDAMAEEMDGLVREQPGFLAMESVRDADGNGITVCYWRSLEDVKNWKANVLHKQAQEMGKAGWYKEYAVRIAEVTESYERV